MGAGDRRGRRAEPASWHVHTRLGGDEPADFIRSRSASIPGHWAHREPAPHGEPAV
jgi:hypothetical protein